MRSLYGPRLPSSHVSESQLQLGALDPQKKGRKGFPTILHGGWKLDMEPEPTSPLRAALQPSALRAALVPRRPVFENPWDSEVDIFACYVAVSFLDPLLLFCGGKLMSSIFGFGSRWPLGLFMAAAIVGAAGFMTIVGRERTCLAVDVLAITAWSLLGLVVAPVLGLAPPTGAAIAGYGVLLL